MSDVLTPPSIPVEEFAPGGDEVERLLDYPGRRPAGSYLTDGCTVVELPNNYDDFHYVTNRMLGDKNLPLIEERTPVLAYGANANPVSLRTKMSTLANHEAEASMQTVPHIRATLPGHLAVWHGRPGQVGSIFAELYKSDVGNHSLTAHVAYLTTEQLALLHISEGITYSAAEVAVRISGGESKTAVLRRVVAYVALQASIMQEDGRPVLVAGLLNHALDLPILNAESAVARMLDATADERGPMSVRSFIEEGRALSLADRKIRQEEIRQILARKGLSREYSFPVESGDLIGRADFSSLPGNRYPHLLHLPEQLLAAIRPTPVELNGSARQRIAEKPGLTYEDALQLARNNDDPARRLSVRASIELSTRTGIKRTDKKIISNKN